MTTYQVGNSVSWSLLVTKDGTTPADLGGGDPVATVTRPDGTTTAATVTHLGVGSYQADVLSTLAGRYRVLWTGSGANSGGLPFAQVADVWPADPRLLIPLADARAALGLAANNTAGDDALRLLIAAATSIVEDMVGPVLVRTVTVTRSGAGSQAIALDTYPSAVASVTENGATLTEGTDFCWDEYGLLWRGSSQMSARWSGAAPRNVAVTYTVGAQAVEPAVIAAGRELVKWLYTRQQVPRIAPGSSPGTSWTPSGFAVPNAVVEMLAPFRGNRVPGMA